MMYFIYLMLGLIIDLGILALTARLGSWDHVVIVLIVSLVVFALWGSCLIGFVKDTIEKQRQDFFSIARYKKEKESYKIQLNDYRDEMKTELVDKYREFEEALMGQVKDSKLIAAVLKDSGYASLLTGYDKTVKELIQCINKCDSGVAARVNDMMARQDDSLWGFAIFIPKSIIYIPEEDTNG